jgi:phospholipid/cholesterol/gamma-HCH transport system ATP-binding protein
MSRDPIIRVRNLTVGYDQPLLEKLDFDIYPGEVFGVLGPSGSGKTTILRHMIGLLPPLGGSIHIDGDDIVLATGIARQRILRKFGVMYQQGALFGSMTVLENIMLPMEEHTRLSAHARDLVGRLKLRLVGLQTYEDYLPAEISGGMRKRVAIARAMALDPRIVFLDEPSAGLDPATSADLDQLIRRLARSLGITFVMVTHEIASILRTNHRAIMLDKATKSIIETGSPSELQDSSIPQVRRFFQQEEREPDDDQMQENQT